MEDLWMMALISVIVGFAGFVDAIAGGGGIISLPAYFLTGLPAHVCYGCNKFSSSCGTTFAALTYFRNGALNVRVALIAAAASFVGSTAGSRFVLLLDDKILRIMMVTALPVITVFMFVKKIGGEEDKSDSVAKKKMIVIAVMIGLLVGAYDGMFGPGTGTIAAIAFTTLAKFDLKTASGNAKLMNLASNYAALITFIMAGAINYKIAVPAAICNIVGGIAGSHMAVTRGSSFIRPVMLIVMLMLVGKTIYDMVV